MCVRRFCNLFPCNDYSLFWEVTTFSYPSLGLSLWESYFSLPNVIWFYWQYCHLIKLTYGFARDCLPKHMPAAAGRPCLLGWEEPNIANFSIVRAGVKHILIYSRDNVVYLNWRSIPNDLFLQPLIAFISSDPAFFKVLDWANLTVIIGRKYMQR